MGKRATPRVAPAALRGRTRGDCYETKDRGLAVLHSPLLNKGTAFSPDERRTLGLTGLLPPEVSTLASQVKRAYLQYERLPDALSKNIYLAALHDSNEVLYFRLFSEHLREMIPVVNDLTVGIAMKLYRHESRLRRGIYLSIDHPGDIEDAFNNLGAGAGDVDMILATDAEHVLGIGDWGVGGIEVSIGKLAIYTAAGGIDPTRVIPVMLDVGTNRESLLDDPTYIGNRHARVRGERYEAFLDAYVAVVTRRFPNALLQWADFEPGNGRAILEKYHDRICTFNDDVQGTGAIALAAAISAVRVCGTPLRHQRVLVFGAGTAGLGMADQLRDAMVREGLSTGNAVSRFWCVDRQGLLTTDMAGQFHGCQEAYARPVEECKGWAHDGDGGGIGLAEVMHRVKPTMLIGASAVSGSFTEKLVREMASYTDRPIIFVISNPPGRAEANAAELIAWTGGRALIATCTPAAPVTYKGVTYVVAQMNNALVYPGLALGAIVSRASRISDSMLFAAASAVSSLVTVRQPGASLLPHVDDLRSVSATVAVAVAEAAVADNLATVRFGDMVEEVQDAMWRPEYRRILAS